MKTIFKSIVIGIVVGCLIVPIELSAKNEKLAQAGFEFLSVVSDARAAAMANAMTSLQIGSSALFFNPAGMANIEHLIDITASNNQWIADIQHNTFSLAFSPTHGRYGVLGLSYQNVNYGDFYGTRVNMRIDAGYDDTGIFQLSSHALGLGYAKRLTEWFSVGGQIRLVKQDLGKSVIPKISTIPDTTEFVAENTLTPFAFDFGTQFKTGFKSLIFGMSIRNFSADIKYVEEPFQLPLVFNLGISMDLFDLISQGDRNQSLYMCIDASHYRSRAEQVKIGLDWQLLKMLSLRCGYISNEDESGLTFGIGVTKFGFTFDYAYTPYGVFNQVQRLTVRMSF
ncbi:MAG TPA: PorV/PorQ family protein [Candidatus Marinimicrobia bacterium]|nr:PorV/PorQ family protein [Candidatus Neomarinimicrobiota bacterium]HRS52017.1 PorV/PorQ family protein [Candidatus Neomarinimicrobiota bacterium]HRU91854.1 PorV/PorQ family protein [Candidatus Neomarinimicrobiota bacterium]